MAARIPLTCARFRRRRAGTAPVAAPARAAHQRSHGHGPLAGQRARAAAVPAQRAAPLVHAHGGDHARRHDRILRRTADLRSCLRHAARRVAARRRACRRRPRHRRAGLRAHVRRGHRLRPDRQPRRRGLPSGGEQVRRLAVGRAALDRHGGLLGGRQPGRRRGAAARGTDRDAIRALRRLAARDPGARDRRRPARRPRGPGRGDRARAGAQRSCRTRPLGRDVAAAGGADRARVRPFRPAHVHSAARARRAPQQPAGTARACLR